MKVVGVFGLVVGASLLLLLIPASSAGHAGKIVATAAGTSVIGALLFQAWRRSRSAETPAVGTASAKAETTEVR
jgi:hypothetical protein